MLLKILNVFTNFRGPKVLHCRSFGPRKVVKTLKKHDISRNRFGDYREDFDVWTANGGAPRWRLTAPAGRRQTTPTWITTYIKIFTEILKTIP